MAFQQGLSGLNSASTALNVTSNNVANAGTVGFKSAQTHFADVYANSLSGSGGAQVGIGSTVAAIQQQFSQGNLTTTNNPLDLAINGGGFYRMSQNGSLSYSRAGQFHLDKQGYVVDDQARQLTGYPADPTTGTITQSAAVPLQLSSANQAPVATGSLPGGGVKANLNFDSRSGVPTVAPFNINNPLSYNFSTPVPVFDSLGNAHTQTLYAVKTAVAGQWVMHSNVDGTAEANSPLTTSTLTFNTSGQLTGTGIVGSSIDLNAVMAGQVPPKVNNATTPLAYNIDFTGSTQFGTAFGTNSLQQDGYASGNLTGVTVGGNGVIRGNYSNGQTRDLGQVVLANFANPNGLTSLGSNQWTETSASGPALVGSPNSASLGVLKSATIEESNVDLTAALVEMITEQRNYQANAQSIKTQDQILQTLVNLR